MQKSRETFSESFGRIPKTNIAHLWPNDSLTMQPNFLGRCFQGVKQIWAN